MKYKEINLLAMVTGNMDATIRFWRDLIGIRKNPVLNDDNPPVAATEGADPQPGKWPDVTRPTPREERFIVK